MRAAPAALVGHLAAQRNKDAPLLMADCYTFTLRSGTVLTYTNADVPITLGGTVFAADSVLVDGLAFNCTVGLEVDQQRVTVSARSTDTIGGVPVLVALARGIFDGCQVQRERAVLTSWTAPPLGSVILFKGRIASIDQIGRTTAEITVVSDLVLLDVALPRNFYKPTCVHTLYDSGCGLIKSAFAAVGTVGANPTTSSIPWTGASQTYAQGTIAFTSGVNAGVTATVKNTTAGALVLAYPLFVKPASGDNFTVYPGCDHTKATCQAKFANIANFRGFPFVPPPTSAY